jgi:hypothetical protein
LEPNHQTHIHIFSDRATKNGLVDVTLQNGDLFVWEDQTTHLHYDETDELNPNIATLSKLCLVS